MLNTRWSFVIKIRLKHYVMWQNVIWADILSCLSIRLTNGITNTAIEPTDPAYGDGYGTEYLDFVRAQFKR